MTNPHPRSTYTTHGLQTDPPHHPAALFQESLYPSIHPSLLHGTRHAWTTTTDTHCIIPRHTRCIRRHYLHHLSLFLVSLSCELALYVGRPNTRRLIRRWDFLCRCYSHWGVAAHGVDVWIRWPRKCGVDLQCGHVRRGFGMVREGEMAREREGERERGRSGQAGQGLGSSWTALMGNRRSEGFVLREVGACYLGSPLHYTREVESLKIQGLGDFSLVGEPPMHACSFKSTFHLSFHLQRLNFYYTVHKPRECLHAFSSVCFILHFDWSHLRCEIRVMWANLR